MIAGSGPMGRLRSTPSSPARPCIPSLACLWRWLLEAWTLPLPGSTSSPTVLLRWRACSRLIPVSASAGALVTPERAAWPIACWLRRMSSSRPRPLSAIVPWFRPPHAAEGLMAKVILRPDLAPPERARGPVLPRLALARRAPALLFPRGVVAARRFCDAGHLVLMWRSPRGCGGTWCRTCGSACRSVSFVRPRSSLASSPPFRARVRRGPRIGGGGRGAPVPRLPLLTESRRDHRVRWTRSSVSGIPLRRPRRLTSSRPFALRATAPPPLPLCITRRRYHPVPALPWWAPPALSRLLVAPGPGRTPRAPLCAVWAGLSRTCRLLCATAMTWQHCRRGQGRSCSSWWGTSVLTLLPVTRSVSPCGALRSLVPLPAALA